MRTRRTIRPPRRPTGPRPISEGLPDAIRAIDPDDPRLEAIAKGLEEGRSTDEVIADLVGRDPAA